MNPAREEDLEGEAEETVEAVDQAEHGGGFVEMVRHFADRPGELQVDDVGHGHRAQHDGRDQRELARGANGLETASRRIELGEPRGSGDPRLVRGGETVAHDHEHRNDDLDAGRHEQ